MKLINYEEFKRLLLEERDKIPLTVPCATYELRKEKPYYQGQYTKHGIRLALRCLERCQDISTDISTIEQPQWISCETRLPENDYNLVHHFKERRRYLVCLQNGTMRIATFGYKEYGWWIDSHGSVLDKKRFTGVEYWLPIDALIEPPKGDE